MEPLAILFGAVFTAAVCMAAGKLILRNACQDAGARFVTGAAALSLLVFALGVLKLAYPGVFLAAGAAVCWFGRPLKIPRPRLAPLLLVFGAFFVLYFFHAMAPEASPDGAGYHLGLVA